MFPVANMMTTALFLYVVAAQAPQPPSGAGSIYGTVLDHDGRPAKRISLMAEPVGVALGFVLPQTKTDENGRYRFVNLTWLGEYTVFAEDLAAGYSNFATGPVGSEHFPSVSLSRDHPEAELNVSLSPPAAFLIIHLTSKETGAPVFDLQFNVTLPSDPDRVLFSTSADSRQAILLRPNTDLLIHVSSRGFNEWVESVGKGKLVHLASGERDDLDVQLEPHKPR